MVYFNSYNPFVKSDSLFSLNSVDKFFSFEITQSEREGKNRFSIFTKMTNKFVWNYLFGEKMNHYFILFYSVQINPTIAGCPAIIYFLFWKYFIIFQDAFIKTGREIDDIEAPSTDAEEDRVDSGEDVDQLVGAVYVRLHEGLRWLLAVRPLQSNQIPGNFFIPFCFVCCKNSAPVKNFILPSN